jgi:UDP-N-acetylmuramyl pentapeptide phosphotransferase/UDP-N-acetylglucosamine-1-phosphate transferase
MNLIIIALGSFAILFLYKALAFKWNILDIPNERSSHVQPTVRGGGIVFPVLTLGWFAFNQISYPFFLIGLILLSIVSFIDDIKNLSFKLRLVTQILAVAAMLWSLGLIGSLSYGAVVLLFLLTVGWLNTFNFMDGINGITALYAISVLSSFWVLNHYVEFIEASFIKALLLITVAFAFFNVRTKAIMFAGDVGSISLAFILAFLMILLFVQTQNWFFILFFLIYGVDSIMTIVERLLKRENIFEAHRSHLYQLLCNEYQCKHLSVSFSYALLQFIISGGVILMYLNNASGYWYPVLMLFILSSYLILKTSLKRKLKKT